MRKIGGIALIIMLLSQTAALSAPAAKPGGKCTKVGATATANGKKFTCIKSGKKLVWNKGVTIIASPKPIPSPTPTPTPVDPTSALTFDYANPSVPSDQLDRCKTKEVSKSRGMTGAGFPEFEAMTPRFGTVKWALIPIDFPDFRGESAWRTRVDDQVKLLSEWFEVVSEGRFKVEWTIASNWVTLPEPSAKYTIGLSTNLKDAANGPKLFKDAMTAADPTFDFTNVQTVNFLLPLGQKVIDETSQGFPWDAAVKEFVANEGRVASFSIPGDFMIQPGKEVWAYWAHEFLHAVGLPHIGTSRGEPTIFHALDILGSQDGPDRELSGWIRFIAGWLPSERIFCKEAKDVTNLELTLVPLSEKTPGIKLAIIPLTETKTLLMESRRVTKFSCTTATKRNGALVYVYDATLGHNEDFLIPQPAKLRGPETDSCRSKNSRTGQPTVDPLLREGEKVTIDGITVEVVRQGNFDKLRITRAP